jgi:hypothetical protein
MPTDIDGLLRDQPQRDDLVERLKAASHDERLSTGMLYREAAAEIVRLRVNADGMAREVRGLLNRAEKAEAECARLTTQRDEAERWAGNKEVAIERAEKAEAERDEFQRLLGKATSERDALKADAERMLSLLRNAMNWIYEAGTVSRYGFYRTKNPHDFSPDPESCSYDEIANHKAACDLWDRGEYDASKEKGSEWLRSEDGKLIAHILRAPWGIGSYSETVPQVQALIDAIDVAREQEKK